MSCTKIEKKCPKHYNDKKKDCHGRTIIANKWKRKMSTWTKNGISIHGSGDEVLSFRLYPRDQQVND